MYRNAVTYRGIRLALALCVSATMHLAAFSLFSYFWQEAHPILPKPEHWKFDVTVAPHGEGISHEQDAPVSQQQATVQAKKENRHHIEPIVRARTARKAVEPKAEASHPALAEVPEAVSAPPADAQSQDTQKQAEALAGAMENLANMQFVLGQMKIFSAVTRTHIQSAITEKFTEEALKQYAGAVCKLNLSYAVPANADFKVDCGERQKLATALASQIDWRALPQPDKFSLGYRMMNVTLWFEGYQVRVGLTPGD